MRSREAKTKRGTKQLARKKRRIFTFIGSSPHGIKKGIQKVEQTPHKPSGVRLTKLRLMPGHRVSKITP